MAHLACPTCSKSWKPKTEVNTSELLSLANSRMRRIHAILTDQAIEWKDANGVITGYTAQIDQKTFRELLSLSNGLGHDEN